MGFTRTILATKPGSGVDVDRVLAEFGFREPESVEAGWVIDEAHRHPDQAADYFIDLVAFESPHSLVHGNESSELTRGPGASARPRAGSSGSSEV